MPLADAAKRAKNHHEAGDLTHKGDKLHITSATEK
jgi:hypothetical protein